MKKLLFVAAINLMFASACVAQSLNIYSEDNAQTKTVDGKFAGLDFDILSELQKRVGNTDRIELVPLTRGIKYLDTQANTILFSLARTKERNNRYQWIGPISESSYGFYAKADSTITINNLDDAKKVASIGVYRNDIRDQFLTKEGFTNLDRADNNISNFKKLMAGRTAVIASSAFGIKDETKRTGYSMQDVKLLYVFFKSPVYIAASKDTNPKVVSSWNSALESMKKDGTLKAIFKKYFPDQEIQDAGVPTF